MIRLEYIPRKWQRTCHQERQRFAVYALHRRAGKTELAIMELIDKAMKFDKPLGFLFMWRRFLNRQKQLPGQD